MARYPYFIEEKKGNVWVFTMVASTKIEAAENQIAKMKEEDSTKILRWVKYSLPERKSYDISASQSPFQDVGTRPHRIFSS